jgi:phenylacetate-CoA ligase
LGENTMENAIFKNLIIPGYYRFFKNNMKIEYLNLLKKRDSLSSYELELIQFINLKRLLEYCYNFVPYYKKLFDSLGILPKDIETLSDYSKLPVLTKEKIKTNTDEFLSIETPKIKMMQDSTSGSTGLPLNLYRTYRDHEYGCALKMRSNSWCGWNYWNKSLWLISDRRHIRQIEAIKGRIDLALNRKLLINTKNITHHNMFNWVKQIKAYKPEYVYGYSTLLANFSGFLLENEIYFDFIKGVFSTAEPLTNRNLIAEAFNAPVFDQYGASEVPCIAHECKYGGMHINSDEVILEFQDISRDSGMKKLIITPLYIFGMPLLRYEIKDTGFFSSKKCNCGLSYPLMELKIGRVSDNLINKNGKIISGVSLSWYITEATNKLNQYQIIQEDFEKIKVTLVDDPYHRFNNQTKIRELLCEMMEDKKLKIDFEYTESLSPGVNGKLRPIISKIYNNPKAQKFI